MCSLQPTFASMSNTPKLYDLTRFARRQSALLEVKNCEIMIHEPTSFLKRGNKLELICMRHFMTWLNSHWVPSRANQLMAWWIDNRGNLSCRFDRIKWNRQYFNPPCIVQGAIFSKSHANRLPAWWIDSRGDDWRLESTTLSTHPQSPDQLYFLSLV